MNEVEVIALAREAGAWVWRRWGFLLPPDLREDVEQEALLGAWRAATRHKDASRGYLFEAARREALMFVFRRWLGRNPTRTAGLEALEGLDKKALHPLAPPAPRAPLSPEEAQRVEEELYRRLLAARKKRKPGSERAARLEARVLTLKLQGHTKSEIARALDIPVCQVSTYAARARARLTEEVEHE